MLTCLISRRCLPFLFSLTAFSLSAATSTSCHFLLLETKNTAIYFGLFRFMDVPGDDICRDLRFFSSSLTDDDFLSAPNVDIFKIAKATGIIAPLMGGIATLIFFKAIFMRISRNHWYVVSNIFLALATLGQLGTFSLFAMEYCKGTIGDGFHHSGMKCSTSDGAHQAIAAIVLYMVTAILCCCIPTPRVPLISFTYNEIQSYEHELHQPIFHTSIPSPNESYIDTVSEVGNVESAIETAHNNTKNEGIHSPRENC